MPATASGAAAANDRNSRREQYELDTRRVQQLNAARANAILGHARDHCTVPGVLESQLAHAQRFQETRGIHRRDLLAPPFLRRVRVRREMIQRAPDAPSPWCLVIPEVDADGAAELRELHERLEIEDAVVE